MSTNDVRLKHVLVFGMLDTSHLVTPFNALWSHNVAYICDRATLMNPTLTDCCTHHERLNELKFHNTEITCTGFIILRIGVNFPESPFSESVYPFSRGLKQ